MDITISYASVADAKDLVCDILVSAFKMNEADAIDAYKDLSFHFTRLKTNCWLVAESPYVDKVYRDSFYQYYSSKHAPYNRDCVRISVFEGEVKEEYFRTVAYKQELQKKYRGFIIMRPTEPFFIGRTVLSAAALQDNNLQLCSTTFSSTVLGTKFQINGFPHASQDTEMMTCAETTLWAMMEYFSTRYAEYRPVLPSKIIQTLNKVSVERQIPSRGLSIPQISFALREFGFGTRIYAKEDFANDFEKIISCYVESGIPVILAVDNHDEKGNIGHAMICIGREKNSASTFTTITEVEYKNGNPHLITPATSKNIKLFDYHEVKRQFVFIDDNMPAYSKATLLEPCSGYKGDDWRKCKAKYVIVPLYKRIHLEAFEARKFIFSFLLIGPYPLQENQEVVLRIYLSSSRSYKDSLAYNNTFQTDLKEKIIGSALPKFVWVCEVSTKELIQQNRAKGVILLDATEANTEMNKPLIIAAYDGAIFEIDKGELIRNPLPLPDFTIYENNLIKAN